MESELSDWLSSNLSLESELGDWLSSNLSLESELGDWLSSNLSLESELGDWLSSNLSLTADPDPETGCEPKGWWFEPTQGLLDFSQNDCWNYSTV